MKAENDNDVLHYHSICIAGFEHCVANMGTFTIGYLLLGDIGTMAVIKRQIFVTLGNIVGGSLLLALPLKLMSAEY